MAPKKHPVGKKSLNELIAGLGLSESAREALEKTVEDLCNKVSDPKVKFFLEQLFQYCSDKQQNKNGLFRFRSLISAYKDATKQIESTGVFKVDNTKGLDRERYKIQYEVNYKNPELTDVGRGKIYVNAKGDFAVFDPHSSEPICEGKLSISPKSETWEEALKLPACREDVRDAVVRVEAFTKACSVSVGISREVLKEARKALLWDKIQKFMEIINNRGSEEKFCKEEVEKFIKRLDDLLLRLERQEVEQEVKKDQEDLEQLSKDATASDKQKQEVKNLQYSGKKLITELSGAVTWGNINSAQKRLAVLKAEIEKVKKSSVEGGNVNPPILPVPSSRAIDAVNALLEKYLPGKVINLENPHARRKLRDKEVQQLLGAALECVEQGELSDDTIKKFLIDFSKIFTKNLHPKHKGAMIAKWMRILPSKVKSIPRDGAPATPAGDNSDQKPPIVPVVGKNGSKALHAAALTPPVDESGVAKSGVTHPLIFPAKKTIASGVLPVTTTATTVTVQGQSPLVENGDDVGQKPPAMPAGDNRGANVSQEGTLIPPGGANGVVNNGINHPAVVPALVPGGPAPLPSQKAVQQNIQGQSPLWHALRELYFHLQIQKPGAEGYKDVSIPRLEQYLKLLEEISKNRDLTVRGQDLWETLNPEGAGFKAVQLLAPLPDGRNILEKARDDHRDHYLPKFQSLLSVEGNKYEVSSCFYIEKISGILYLMRKDGTNPSTIELQDAFAKYQVICQDMEGSVEAKIYICNDAFTQKPEIQEKIAAIVNCLDLKLAAAETVPTKNQAIQNAVKELSVKMVKGSKPETAENVVAEGAEDTLADKMKNYRVTLADGRCLLPASKLEDTRERVEYLTTVYTWEQRCKYLSAVSTVNRVLPKVKKDSYRREETLVYLDLLGTQTVKELDEEMQKRTVQREYRCLEERKIQAAIADLLQEWDEDAFNRARLASLQSYETEEEQREHLKNKCGFDIQDVPGDGSCFYRAVADQLKQQGNVTFEQENVELHQSLRSRVQGKDVNDKKWADIDDLVALIKKTEVVIAIVDTRYPELGFRCYFINKQGKLAEAYSPEEFKQNAVASHPIIRLAYTGEHYISIIGYPALAAGALREEFNIAKERQKLQQTNVVPEGQHQSSQIPADIASQGQRALPHQLEFQPKCPSVQHQSQQGAGSKNITLLSENSHSIFNQKISNQKSYAQSSVSLSTSAILPSTRMLKAK